MRPATRRAVALCVSLVLLLSGCEPAPPPEPAPVAAAYARAWSKGDARALFDLLTDASRARYGEAGVVERLPRIAEEMTLRSLDVAVGLVSRPVLPDGKADPRRATFPLRATFHTAQVGDFTREVALPLVLVGEPPQARWQVEWSPELILPRLATGRLVRMTRLATSRGRILARDGTELATFADAAAVGVVPGQMRSEAATIASLSSTAGIPADEIRAKLAQPWVRSDSFVPIRTLYDVGAETRARLTVIEGVQVRPQRVRAYPTGLAAQTLGYLGEASDADAKKAMAAMRGVAVGDPVGATGLEAALDDALGGRYGWRLAIVEANGAPVETLAETPAVAGLDVVLALDVAMQRAAETSLGDQRGAVVAEDPNTGEILALASRPSFDLNAFARGDAGAITKLNADPLAPLLNRATSGQYTVGSTFKLVTTAAALRAGAFQPGETIACPFRWTGYGPLYAQVNHETSDLGIIDLRTALARSCNSFFYELGKRLNDKDRDLLPKAALSFGLGKATDVDFVLEEEGIVPSAAWKQQRFAADPVRRVWNPGDATNLAIGQGDFLATPIQMANYVSAVAIDGTVWKPRLVIALQDRAGKVQRRYEPVRAGKAVATAADLALIRDGMRGVVADPQGTVYFPFRTFAIPVAGKSGTAETGGAPNAWFIGFAPYDKPAVAIATVYEQKPGLLGSQDAAATSRAVLGARFGTP